MKTIQTKSGKILVVRVPRNATSFQAHGLFDHNRLLYYVDGYATNIYLEVGDWKVISTWSKLTEEHANELVDKNYETATGGMWKNYLDPENTSHLSAKKSFESLMKANECYLVNPYGKKPDIDWKSQRNAEDSILKWKQAEEQTGEYLILIEKK